MFVWGVRAFWVVHIFDSCAFGSCVCRDRGWFVRGFDSYTHFVHVNLVRARFLVCLVFCLCAHLARVLCVCILLVYAF